MTAVLALIALVLLVEVVVLVCRCSKLEDRLARLDRVHAPDYSDDDLVHPGREGEW